jgi:hypothetical protein
LSRLALNLILLISASSVAKITGVSHQRSALCPFRERPPAERQWLMPIIPATQKAEIRRMVV